MSAMSEVFAKGSVECWITLYVFIFNLSGIFRIFMNLLESISDFCQNISEIFVTDCIGTFQKLSESYGIFQILFTHRRSEGEQKFRPEEILSGAISKFPLRWRVGRGLLTSPKIRMSDILLPFGAIPTPPTEG